MASAEDEDERPTLKHLIEGPREENFTLLEDEFGGEAPMEELFHGVTKDTNLSSEEFEFYFPDEPLHDRMNNIVALGQAGFDYHQKRIQSEDGVPQNIVFEKSVLQFDGKFYKSGGKVFKDRFTLNDNGETVEADEDGNPTTVHYFGIDDYYLPNLLDTLLEESKATTLTDFVNHAKMRGKFNKARVLQKYWNIKKSNRVAVAATPHKPPLRGEDEVTPPPVGSTMKEQLEHYIGKASAHKKEKLTLQKQSSARDLDHSNLCTASILYAEANKTNAEANSVNAESHRILVGAHKNALDANDKKDAKIKQLQAKIPHRLASAAKPKAKPNVMPKSARKVAIRSDDDDDIGQLKTPGGKLKARPDPKTNRRLPPKSAPLHAFQAEDMVILKPAAAKLHKAAKGRILEADSSKEWIQIELHQRDNTLVTKRIKHTSLAGLDDENADE